MMKFAPIELCIETLNAKSSDFQNAGSHDFGHADRIEQVKV
jgi:hypothetical protein